MGSESFELSSMCCQKPRVGDSWDGCGVTWEKSCCKLVLAFRHLWWRPVYWHSHERGSSAKAEATDKIRAVHVAGEQKEHR